MVIFNLLQVDRAIPIVDNWATYDPESDSLGRNYVQVEIREEIDDTRVKSSQFDPVIIFPGKTLTDQFSIHGNDYDSTEVVRVDLRGLDKDRLILLKNYIRDIILLPNYKTLSDDDWEYFEFINIENLHKSRQYRFVIELRIHAYGALAG